MPLLGGNFNPLSLYRERPFPEAFQRHPLHFNPLSLYRERPRSSIVNPVSAAFQSTLPIQGETFRLPIMDVAISFQSTLPIQGETAEHRNCICRLEFQSTLPIQGETGLSEQEQQNVIISIHSPYTGRDDNKKEVGKCQHYFNPLSLYRERHETARFHLSKYLDFNPLSLYRERQQFCT